MTKWLRTWRRFVIKEAADYQGILKIPLDGALASAVEPLQHMLPEEAVRLVPEDLHVTLIHQSILKPFKEKLQEMDLPTPPLVVLEQEVWERKSPGKKSWAVRVANQDEMRKYVSTVMKMLNSDNLNPEPERVFHVSLANLTGNPHDSVR